MLQKVDQTKGKKGWRLLFSSRLIEGVYVVVVCLHALWPLHGYCHARLVFLAVSFVNASITFHLLFQKLFYYWWSFHPLLEPAEPFLVPVLAKIQTPKIINARKDHAFKTMLIFPIWNWALVNFMEKLFRCKDFCQRLYFSLLTEKEMHWLLLHNWKNSFSPLLLAFSKESYSLHSKSALRFWSFINHKRRLLRLVSNKTKQTKAKSPIEF